MIKERIKLIATLGVALLVASFAAEAQQTGRIARIGYLAPGFPTANAPLLGAFRDGLRMHGYVEGRNLAIEFRFAEGRFEWLPRLAAELVAIKPDVIFAAGTLAAKPAAQATKTIPIVMLAGDPVGSGLVTSLAKPGGNVTGVTNLSVELAAKRISLLREALPSITRVGVLMNPVSPIGPPQLKDTEAAARSFGWEVIPLEAQAASDYEPAFAVAIRKRVHALVILVDPLQFAFRHTELMLPKDTIDGVE